MINVANLQFDEILTKINDSENAAEELRHAVTNNIYIREYIEYMVSEQWPKFDVNTVEWKSIGLDRSEVGAYLLNRNTFNTFKSVICADNVKQHVWRYHVKSILEMLYEAEAKILLAILNKNLVELYPNITFEICCKSL